MKKFAVVLLFSCFLFFGCSSVQKICSKVGYEPTAVDLSEKRESTPEAVDLANKMKMDVKDPYLCHSSDDCSMWEYCITECQVSYDNEVRNMQCPIETNNPYSVVMSDEGICVEVPCRDKCDPAKNIIHYGCCPTEVIRE